MFQLEQSVSNTGIEMRRLFVLVTMTLLLTSCGGGGGTNFISTFESSTYAATYSTSQLPSLYYEASPSGLKGTVAAGERFSFKNGDVVTFYISATNRFLVAKSPQLTTSFTDLNTQNAEIEKPLLKAYYGSPPVKGLVYENTLSGLKGVTDESGRFSFFSGDESRFYIGNENRIYIGKLKPVNEVIVNPTVANVFDPEVDAAFVFVILYTFDIASAGSQYMDFSNLILGDSVTNKIKNILARKKVPNLISDSWKSLASLQSEVVGNTFRNTAGKLSDLDHELFFINSNKNETKLEIQEDDYLGVHHLSYGLGGASFNFLSDGTLVGISDEGRLSYGTYVKNNNGISYRWNRNPLTVCDLNIRLWQRGEQWSLITIDENDIPIGCTHSLDRYDLLRKARVNERVSIDYVSGKNLRIPVNGVCTFGEGEVVFRISSNGPDANQKNVEVNPSACTENRIVSGIVRESGIPGVLVFEFDNASPRSKFFFSVLQQSGRAMTSYSIEKTVPNVEFDFVYGAETTFVLE